MSLSLSFMVSEGSRICGLHVLLSRPDHTVFGGYVLGMLIAATPVENTSILLPDIPAAPLELPHIPTVQPHIPTVQPLLSLPSEDLIPPTNEPSLKRLEERFLLDLSQFSFR
uniref:AT-hook motif nuclear-localized protein n=1 Tax=Solanum tuberosum TaxID=4113 RepID=M1DIM4_SOLTU